MALSSVAPAIRRNLTLAILASMLLAQGIFVAWTATGEKPHAAWDRVISAAVWPAYADLRAVTAGWDEVATGFDPLRLDEDAPLYNYPRLWLAGGRLGWRSADAVWLGTVVTALFLAAVFAVLRMAPGWTRLVALGFLVSPAVWLGLERGNTDLLIFALVTPALLAAPRSGWRGVWPSGLILLAALLKFYPAVVLAARWPQASRAARWILALTGLLFGCYLAGTRADVHAALAKTLKGTQLSYGVTVAADKIQASWSGPSEHGSALAAGKTSAQKILRWLVAGLIGVTGLAALRPAWRTALPVSDAIPESTVRLFLGGAAVYLVTFLLGHNWAYRLIFLVWTLPFLGYVAQKGSRGLRGCAGVTLGLIIFLGWQISSHGIAAGLSAQLASLVLVFPLAWVAATLLLPKPTGPHRARTIGLVGAAFVAGALGCAAAGAEIFSRPADEAWHRMQRGLVETQGGIPDEAEADFQAALRLWPDYADAHDQYGFMLWSVGRRAEAVTHFERAIELAPRSARARNHLGIVRRGERRWTDAIALHQAALAIRPREVVSYNHLGLAYLGARRLAEALATFAEALRLAPDNAQTERNLGVTLANAGRAPEAGAHFAQALRLDPEYAEAEMQWGIVLAGIDRLPEALDHLEHAVALEPESGPAHFFTSVALRQLGRTEEADTHYREAVRLDPALGGR